MTLLGLVSGFHITHTNWNNRPKAKRKENKFLDSLLFELLISEVSDLSQPNGISSSRIRLRYNSLKNATLTNKLGPKRKYKGYHGVHSFIHSFIFA